METLGRYRTWLLVLLGLLLAVAGVLAWLLTRDDPDAAGRVPPPSAPSGAEVVSGTRLPEAKEVTRRPGDPLRILIPDLDVNARVLPILAPGGVLTPPSDPQQLGWWAHGARPGDARGSALVTGHTVSTGGGALDDLEDLDEGDAIKVRSDGSRTDYTVREVEVLSKGGLKKNAKLLFSQAVPGRLVVVTCEDWNGEVYLSNVVVTATPSRRS